MVDDEEDLVWSTSRQVSRERPDLEFVGLADPKEALARVKESPPDVLVTDVRMPGMSGLELIVAARNVAPQLPVVVVTAYGSAEVRAEVQRTSGVEYLDKPFTLVALLAAIDQATSGGSGFSGAISLPMLPDLIQIYAISRASGALRITRGSEQGAIWFQAGDIAHATCGELRGEEAVYRLLTWNSGAFTLDSNASPPERTITGSWQGLLVEGCRLIDESQRGVSDSSEAPLGDRLWERVSPLVSETAPGALVVTLDLAHAQTVVRQGASRAAEWAEAVSAIAGCATRICGPLRGLTLEAVSAQDGVLVVWDRDQEAALVLADTVAGRNGVSRFRSGAARLREACGSLIHCG